MSNNKHYSTDQLKQVIRGLKAELIQHQEKLTEYEAAEDKITMLMNELKTIQKEKEEEKQQLLKRIDYLESVSNIPNIKEKGPSVLKSKVKQEDQGGLTGDENTEVDQQPSGERETSTWFFESVKNDSKRAPSSTAPSIKKNVKKQPTKKQPMRRMSSEVPQSSSGFLSSMQNDFK